MVNLNEQWNAFIVHLAGITDKLCPIRTFQFTKSRPVYISDEIIEFIKRTEYVFKTCKEAEQFKLLEERYDSR